MPFTRLRYHIVTATHGRQPLINAEVEQMLYPVLRAKAEKMGASIMFINGVEDHIHIIAAVPSSVALAKFIGDVKAAGSGAINSRKLLATKFEWQSGYGAFTLNPHDMQGVIDYVQNQKEHHARRDIWPLYERTEE